VICVFQTDKPQMKNLRRVSFHVDYFGLARQIVRVVSEPKAITHAARLAGLGRIFVHVQTMIQRVPYL
jgi:hypothetical protein